MKSLRPILAVFLISAIANIHAADSKKGDASPTPKATPDSSGLPDPVNPFARELPVAELPEETLVYLLSSRYCEVDLLSNTAANLFGAMPRGWQRVQAVCDWVHNHITFGYEYARNTRTALEVFNERVGVCRDFQHLAVTMCRCLNIPARYATGYQIGRAHV